MSVYLIQTSGAEIASVANPAYVSAAEGPRFCDEPLRHQCYFNAEPYWKQGFQRRRAWQTASAGDVALLYCTGSVDEFPSRLSHVLPIAEKRIVPDEGAWLEFEETIALASPITYATLTTQREHQNFSEGMERCGQEGFNFRRVREKDLDRVEDLSPPASGSWEDVP
jgi:hypothetical protein